MNADDPNIDETMPWKQIVAQAVHDMRSPLSSMVTTIEILRMLSTDSDRSGKMIGMLERQVEQLSKQLETLVNHPEAFARHVEPRPFEEVA